MLGGGAATLLAAILLAAVLLAAVLAACASPTLPAPTTPDSTSPTSATSSTGAPITSPASVSAGGPTSGPTTVPTVPTVPVSATAVISPIPDSQWARIVAAGAWRVGQCPGTQATYRRVEVPYLGYDGQPHRGVLVVNADVAHDTAAIFEQIYAAGFPIYSIRPIEEFGGSDLLSEEANNTSSFNCREQSEANSPAANSPHANGRAIDINPVQNPWIQPRTGVWEPAAGTIWATASRRVPTYQRAGVILPSGPVYAAFTARGWTWSGWGSSKDYMHFDTGYPSVAKAGH